MTEASLDDLPPPSVHRLDGKVALVTGAGRGIGRACALALAAAGAEVVALARTAAEVESAAALIRARGGRATAHECDVTDPEALAAVFGTLTRLDVLVNNAGGNRPQDFLDVEPDTLDRLIALNLRSAFLAAQHAARLMQAAGGGAIVNMTSQYGHVGAPKRTVYCAVKHALEGFTKAAALDLAPHGIRVVAVAPTGIETPGVSRMLSDPAFKEHMLRSIPIGRIGSVWDVAHAVVFLASPAAALITGSSLLVDGGWTAR